MNTINRLAGVAFGVHLADQIALVSVPLIAALAFKASPEVIGILVACQSSAHLLGSLPFGILIDRTQLRTAVILATLVSLVGFLAVSTSINTGSLVGFGIAVTFAGFGVVLFSLAALSIVPHAAPSKGLARANAKIEIPRTVASFLVPLVVGVSIADRAMGWVFPVAVAGTAIAFIFALNLPRFEKNTTSGEGIMRRVLDGGAYVLNNSFLRAISLCAVSWNLAFTALLVVMLPLLTEVYLIEAGAFGIALAAFGLAAIIGTWVAGKFAAIVPPKILLLFGPAISTLAAFILYTIPVGGPSIAVYGAFFLLGFGPAMWLVAQNSVRQLVTPAPMLGRVNAVIQTAIYGMRPIGAIIGGAVVGATSPKTGLAVVIVAFALSFLAAALSRLRSIRHYDDLNTLPATG